MNAALRQPNLSGSHSWGTLAYLAVLTLAPTLALRILGYRVVGAAAEKHSSSGSEPRSFAAENSPSPTTSSRWEARPASSSHSRGQRIESSAASHCSFG